MQNTQNKNDLKDTIKDIEKSLEKGSIIQFNSKNHKVIESISTGSLSLNIALDIAYRLIALFMEVSS